MFDWVMVAVSLAAATAGTAAVVFKRRKQSNAPFELVQQAAPENASNEVSGACSNKQMTVAELKTVSDYLSKLAVSMGCNAAVVALSSPSKNKPNELTYYVGYKGPLLIIDGLARRLTVIADDGWGMDKESSGNVVATSKGVIEFLDEGVKRLDPTNFAEHFTVTQRPDEDPPPVEIAGHAEIKGVRT
jgi:hypothetical protein